MGEQGQWHVMAQEGSEADWEEGGKERVAVVLNWG